MLDTSECKEYFDKVMQFAEQVGKLEQFKSKLNYLDNYACHESPLDTKCILYPDFAPYSFEFVMLKRNKNGEYERWYNGGIIFHSSHDGYGAIGSAPTLAVCINPTDGWSIHT